METWKTVQMFSAEKTGPEQRWEGGHGGLVSTPVPAATPVTSHPRLRLPRPHDAAF